MPALRRRKGNGGERVKVRPRDSLKHPQGGAVTKKCSCCGIEKPLDEFYRLKTSRDWYRGRCKICDDARARARRIERARRNPDEARARNAANYRRNRNNHLALMVAWAKRHPEKIIAKNARRRASKSQAVPSWRNDFFIGEAYALARLRSKVMGYRWAVDHLVPLRHPLVCGLHVENNLQVIPAMANSLKGNRSWPEMP